MVKLSEGQQIDAVRLRLDLFVSEAVPKFARLTYSFVERRKEGDRTVAYRDVQSNIRDLIVSLQAIHNSVGKLVDHRCNWDDRDYCTICGEDGRA